ncbi:MAG: hypothetical protein KME13_25990 [Myxacorys californica WJT36-NPBG1]|nr:hypothetical protein [Myxacorys californica WJT36-NPBG1]
MNTVCQQPNNTVERTVDRFRASVLSAAAHFSHYADCETMREIILRSGVGLSPRTGKSDRSYPTRLSISRSTVRAREVRTAIHQQRANPST